MDTNNTDNTTSTQQTQKNSIQHIVTHNGTTTVTINITNDDTMDVTTPADEYDAGL